jgi:hypothetical protein
MNKTEEAANLLVEKLREHVKKNSIYEKRNFEVLIFEKRIEVMHEKDNNGNLNLNEIFRYAEKNYRIEIGAIKQL